MFIRINDFYVILLSLNFVFGSVINQIGKVEFTSKLPVFNDMQEEVIQKYFPYIAKAVPLLVSKNYVNEIKIEGSKIIFSFRSHLNLQNHCFYGCSENQEDGLCTFLTDDGFIIEVQTKSEIITLHSRVIKQNGKRFNFDGELLQTKRN